MGRNVASLSLCTILSATSLTLFSTSTMRARAALLTGPLENSLRRKSKAARKRFDRGVMFLRIVGSRWEAMVVRMRLTYSSVA